MLAHLANINFFRYDLQIYTVKINPWNKINKLVKQTEKRNSDL